MPQDAKKTATTPVRNGAAQTVTWRPMLGRSVKGECKRIRREVVVSKVPLTYYPVISLGGLRIITEMDAPVQLTSRVALCTDYSASWVPFL
jgi:hypothetical protein